jgi:hypothetical protein
MIGNILAALGAGTSWFLVSKTGWPQTWQAGGWGMSHRRGVACREHEAQLVRLRGNWTRHRRCPPFMAQRLWRTTCSGRVLAVRSHTASPHPALRVPLRSDPSEGSRSIEGDKSPSGRTFRSLDGLNFFLADVQTGRTNSSPMIAMGAARPPNAVTRSRGKQRQAGRAKRDRPPAFPQTSSPRVRIKSTRVNRKWPRSREQQEDAPEQHRVIRAGLMSHRPESAFHQDRDLGRGVVYAYRPRRFQ